MDFRSDNVWGASPEILDALAAANSGSAGAYGDDDWTTALEARFAEVFEREVGVFVVGTGSAANGLALSVMAPPWGVVYCHKDAHVEVDECGGPEFFTGGAKLATQDGKDGKLQADALAPAIVGKGFVHAPQPAGISITQASEAGTVYRPAEVRALSELARANGLKLHMDGARFANALVSLETSPAEITWKAGVDLLSFGGTKNGCMAGEALLVFDPDLAETLGFRRKRVGHLFSKMRFFSVQLLAYLEGDLWLKNARRANAAAMALAGELEALGATLAHPTEANEVFAQLPDDLVKRLEAAGFLFYPWPAAGAGGHRFVASFLSDAEAVRAAFRRL
ncbi:MAG: low specificity L-threonine aldolase [Kiloniellales bacterium]